MSLTRSLRSRLVLSAAVFAALVIGVLLTALQDVFERTLEQMVQQRLAADAATLIGAANVVDGLLQMPERMPDEDFNLPEAKLLGYVHDLEGRVIWHSRSTADQELHYLPVYSGDNVDFLRTRDKQGNEYYVYDVEVQLSDKHGLPLSFVTMLPTNEFSAVQKDFNKRLRLWLLASLVLLLILLWWALTWSLSSLQGVRRELQEVESGSRERLSDLQPEELMRLTRSLNRLLDSERLQRTRYRDSLGDLAHSLKTPLAVLQTVAENLQPREQARVLQGQIERMSQQVDYQLQRASLRRSGLVRHQVTLAPLVARLGDALNKVYRDKHVELEIDIAHRLQIPVEEAALLELLGSLLENAYRLCRSHIRVRAAVREGTYSLVVEDDGPGVPPSQRERIIGRGERFDKIHPGDGIGLAVVKDIVESYGGELSLDDSPLGGAAFKIHL